MTEEKLGCFGHTWNFVALIVLTISSLFSCYAFVLSDSAYYVRLGTLFIAVTSGVYTAYQVYKRKPDGLLRQIKHEFFITRKSISGSAIWLNNMDRERIEKQTGDIKAHISEEAKKTLQANSEEYGIELLKTTPWRFVPERSQFYCLENANWNISIDNYEDNNFYELWVDHVIRSDRSIVTFFARLQYNATPICSVRFILLDGHRKLFPLPHAYSEDGETVTYHYCEDSIEHRLFKVIVRDTVGDYENYWYLVALANEAGIEWRQC